MTRPLVFSCSSVADTLGPASPMRTGHPLVEVLTFAMQEGSRRAPRRSMGDRRVTDRTMRAQAAIVGVADIASPTGVLDQYGRGLEVAMIRAALADAGLTIADVDGIAYGGMPTGLAEYLGVRPRFLDGTMVG